MDTGIFFEDRYFDVEVEYAKADPEDILISIHVSNRGPQAAAIDLLPTVWFRNTWSWRQPAERPLASAEAEAGAGTAIALVEPMYNERWLNCEGAPALLFTENETNYARLYGDVTRRYSKDAFHRLFIEGEREAVNPHRRGTKAAAHYPLHIPASRTVTVRLRLNDKRPSHAPLAHFPARA